MNSVLWQGWCAGALALTGIRAGAGTASGGDASFGVSSHAGGSSLTADLRRQAGIAGASPTAFSEEVRLLVGLHRLPQVTEMPSSLRPG